MINMSDMSKSFPSSIVLRIDFQVLSIQFYSLIVIKGIFWSPDAIDGNNYGRLVEMSSFSTILVPND